MSSKYLYGVLLMLISLSKEILVFNEEVHLIPWCLNTANYNIIEKISIQF